MTLPYYRKRGPFADRYYMFDLHARVEKKTLNMYNFMLILRTHKVVVKKFLFVRLRPKWIPHINFGEKRSTSFLDSL